MTLFVFGGGSFPGEISQIFVTINVDILCVGNVVLLLFDCGGEGFVDEFASLIMLPLGVVDHGHVLFCYIEETLILIFYFDGFLFA